MSENQTRNLPNRLPEYIVPSLCEGIFIYAEMASPLLEKRLDEVGDLFENLLDEKMLKHNTKILKQWTAVSISK